VNIWLVDAAELTARVLALVLERHPRTVVELETAADGSADGVRAALDALERHGLVEWDAARTHVSPGPREVRYAQSGRDLAELAQPAMRRLASESGETVNLMVRTAGGAEAIAQVDGRHVLGVSNWIGREVPDHCSAAGKVFLAFGAAALPAGQLERRTPRTIVDRPLLERELEAVRRRGYATIVDELELGLAAVAAPVRDAAGAVVAALSVAGPTARLGEARLGLLGRVAIEQAHAVSVQLGFTGELEDLLDSLRARRSYD
jgi:IclR family transcriptional regulator, acetate operon repressor